MRQEVITGIDIGTHAIKIVITEIGLQNTPPKILHATQSPSHGFRHGYIIDSKAASLSLKKALQKIEKISKQQISHARFSIGGIGLSSQYVRTSIPIQEKEGEITEEHISELIQKSEKLFIQKYPNKKILHIIPTHYKVDNENVLGNPIGMYGEKIEIKINFVTIMEHHYDALIQVIQNNNISPQDIIAGPFADAAASLNYRQKSQGCMLANIGSETSSLTSFENGVVTSLQVYSIGSNNITNDLALGFQTNLNEAENIKIKQNNKDISKKRFDEIVQARITDILELIEKQLEKNSQKHLIPAGIIFTGGGSKINLLEEYTKKILKIGAQKAVSKNKKSKSFNNDPSYTTAYGLCFNEGGSQIYQKTPLSIKKIKRIIKNIIHQITP